MGIQTFSSVSPLQESFPELWGSPALPQADLRMTRSGRPSLHSQPSQLSTHEALGPRLGRNDKKPWMTVATCRSWGSHRHHDSCHSCRADWERRVHLAQVGFKQAALNFQHSLCLEFLVPCASRHRAIPLCTHTSLYPGGRTPSASTPREPDLASQCSPRPRPLLSCSC